MRRAAFNRNVLVAAGTVLACTSAAFAHNIDPAAFERERQRQQRQIELRDQPKKLEGPAVVGPRPAAGVIFPAGGAQLVLKQVVFEASRFITQAELDGISAKYIGTKVDLAALQRMVEEINALYAAKGVITGNASLPPQNVVAGIVKVRLVEGRLDKLSLEGNVQTSADYIKAHFPMEPGEVLDSPGLSQRVAWFNRTSDVQVRALLQPGTDFGQTDVRLSVIEPARDTLQLFSDNQGVKATGLYEGGVFYRRHSLFGIDDRLTFYGIKSDGNLSGNVAYNVPFGLTDGRLGVSYSRGAIHIVDGALAALNQKGSSQTASVNLAQPVFVDERWTVLLNLGSSYGTSASTISDTPITDNHTTRNGGGFTLTTSAQNYSFSVSANVAQALTRNELLGSKRSFTLVTGTTTNLIRLPEDFSLSLLGAGQYADAVLLPGDVLFNIGGPTTVRGYPSNASGGDSGYYTNLELHKNWNALATGLDTYLFTDYGQIYSTFPINREAWSAGVGLSWTPVSWVTTELSIGFPLKTLVANQSEYTIYYRVSLRPL
jgi:hemolysin activation/secretion protein